VNLLYLCHRIPYPPDKGEKIRAFHELRTLTERYDVDLFTLADDAGDLGYQAELKKFCRTVFVARLNRRWARLRTLPRLLSSEPLSLSYFRSQSLSAALRTTLRQRRYDRVFVYCSAMAQYLEDVPPGIPVIADLVDVDSDKWTQYAGFSAFPLSAVYRREARRLRETERTLSERASCALVCTAQEAKMLRLIAPEARVEVVPNGVDTGFFQPAAGRSDAGTVVFTGDMSYFPNQQAVEWFAREVLPLVRREIAEVRFRIVGRNPGRRVRELARPGEVEVTGYVPDIRIYLTEAVVAVAPLRVASGIQNKILEAMACGLPVVATPMAARSLKDGARALVETATAPTEFAAKVVQLLRDPAAARRRGIEARLQVVKEYGWDSARRRLLELVEAPPRRGAEAPVAGLPLSSAALHS
jgi:polysaccharide biosynthesis protein PslH